MSSLTRKFRRWLWDLGYDISRFQPATHTLARRRQLVRQYGVDLVLDVGANAGQYATAMRRDVGYLGRMISFEPVRAPFALLERAAQRDAQWEALNYGLGARIETVDINVAGNSFSSSLLNMLPAHLASAPESRYTGTEKIQVNTLDSVFPGLVQGARSVYLKIDTQGLEKQVLEGGRHSLGSIGTVQLEMSLAPLYEGEPLFPEMHAFLAELGYRMVAVETGFMDDASGELLQIDGIFRRNQATSR
jgi:FkbM family methyltransferase